MKKLATRIGLVWFIVLYVFTLVNFIGNTIHTNAARIDTCSSILIDSDIQNSPIIFLSAQSQGFSLNEGFDNIQTPVRKTHHFNSFASKIPNELLQKCIYSTFISYSAQIDIQFQETDIVFPFHFFL